MLTEKTYLDFLKESSGVPLQESIPWRNSNVVIEQGKTALGGLNQHCLVLNELKFIFTWKPSFMFVVPDIELLYKPGGATNGYIITARKAQQLEFTSKERGTCYAKTYFFGRPKPGRIFDWWQRLWEHGFTLGDIKGLSKFQKGATVTITCQKKDFRKTTLYLGRQIPDIKSITTEHNLKILARFRTS